MVILKRVYNIITACLVVGYYGNINIRIENGVIIKCSVTQDFIK